MASRQAVGESLLVSNTSGSTYPGTTIRAEVFVSKGISAVGTNRDCITRSCKPCFLSVRQMTLVFLPCIHCLEKASRNSRLSRPIKPCHCFSLHRAAFARNASCNSSDTIDACLSLPFLPLVQKKAKVALMSDDVEEPASAQQLGIPR